MSKYFKFFPTVSHDLTNNGQKVKLTNILRRFKIDTSVKNNVSVFHDYDIQSHDRPDTIAKKYYGDDGYAWVILMYNEIHDPFFQWPMFGYQFDQYINSKYGNIAVAHQTVHEYRRILNPSSLSFNTELNKYENGRNYDGTTNEKRYVVIDVATYNTLPDSDKELITKYDYEVEKNEQLRRIKILDKRYLSLIKDEVKNILKVGI